MKAKRGEVWRGFILFLLEPWIAGSDASGMIDARTREFGISRLPLLKAPQFSRSINLRGVAALTLELHQCPFAIIGTLKCSNATPTRYRSGCINGMRNRGIWRYDQIPSNQDERSGVATVHWRTIAPTTPSRKAPSCRTRLISRITIRLLENLARVSPADLDLTQQTALSRNQ